MTRLSALFCGVVLCLLQVGQASAATSGGGGSSAEAVVTLVAPPLAGLHGSAARTASTRIDAVQARFEAALQRAVPSARIRWRYRIVLDGAAVVVPRSAIPVLRRLPGVAHVDVGASYPVASVDVSKATAAAKVWTTGLSNGGDGVKIGIIDDGIDQKHPYFNPAGYTMPAGFPKGQKAYTTAKVIVARAFAPASVTYKYARVPFDPLQSEHGTHVAGIAAGNAGTQTKDGQTVSGVAPRAYLGNYKALSVPTPSSGLDGNAAELVAAIEAAVRDGMNVINLSVGEPEVEPSRDLVALALDGAADAGVVPVVAAGNDFEEFGRGTLSSPGSSDKAITVAAVTSPSSGKVNMAWFSSAGPTPISLRLKPDVSAPGVSIVSSVPDGGWQSWNGTSMASPQIAGAAALLRERHPTWPVDEIKAALIGSGTLVDSDGTLMPPTRAGGGLAAPAKADAPLVLASPASVSFGLLRPGDTATADVALTDGGGGAGPWEVAVEPIATTSGATLTTSFAGTVPGTLELTATVAAGTADGDLSGYVRLTRGADVRRVPFWLHVTRAALSTAPTTPIGAPGVHAGDTSGKPPLASRYRYPDVPSGGPVSATLQGPEQLFRLDLTRPVANFGVVILHREAGVQVEPRVVEGADENRLTGYPALPLYLNPYTPQLYDPVLAAGAVRPLPGEYEVVFDSPTPAGAGRFTFRYWIDDTTPPTVRLDQLRMRRGVPLVARVSDGGSGVDPGTLEVRVDGKRRTATLRAGVVRIPTTGLAAGRHLLRVQISDYQESRNMENVPPILPNTRVLSVRVVIR